MGNLCQHGRTCEACEERRATTAVIKAAREALVVMEGILDIDLMRVETKLRAALKKWESL